MLYVMLGFRFIQIIQTISSFSSIQFNWHQITTTVIAGCFILTGKDPTIIQRRPQELDESL